MRTSQEGSRTISAKQNSDPDSHQLAEIMALAARVEPALIRTARLELLPDSSAEAEAELWFSDLVISRGIDGITLDPDQLPRLRKKLLSRTRTWVHHAINTLNQVHSNASSIVRLEEALTQEALLHPPNSTGRAESQNRIERRWQGVLAAMLEAPETVKNFARWIIGASGRLPADALQVDTARRLVAMANIVAGGKAVPDEKGIDISEVGGLLTALLGNESIGVQLLSEAIEFSRPPAAGSHTLIAPATLPISLHLSLPNQRQRSVVLPDSSVRRIQLDRDQDLTLNREFVIETLSGDSYVLRPRQPLAGLVDLLDKDGDLPLVRDMNPDWLGVTSTEYAPWDTAGAQDPYMPRTHNDVAARLQEALAPGRMVLLVGPAKAGKTRSAFEAVRARWPQARLLAPAPAALAALARHPRLHTSKDPVVVWLDDLQRYLTGISDPLTPALLKSVLARPGPTMVIATLRTENRTALFRDGGELTVDTRRLLEAATEIELGTTNAQPTERLGRTAKDPEPAPWARSHGDTDPGRQPRHALVIGSQCNALLTPPLTFLPAAAQRLYGALTDPSRGGCDLGASSLLLDPTLAELREAVEIAVARASAANATLVFAFMGHAGTRAKSYDRHLFLLPINGNPEAPNPTTAYEIGLHLNSLQLDGMDGLILILDICAAGAGILDVIKADLDLKDQVRLELLAGTYPRQAEDGCFSRSLIELMENGQKDLSADYLDVRHAADAVAHVCREVQDPPVYLGSGAGKNVSDTGLWVSRNVASPGHWPLSGTPEGALAVTLTHSFRATPDLERVTNALESQRLVVIQGDRGSGKSALIAALARPELVPDLPGRYLSAVAFISITSSLSKLAGSMSKQLTAMPGFPDAAAAYRSGFTPVELERQPALVRLVFGPLKDLKIRPGKRIRLAIDGIDQLSPEVHRELLATVLEACRDDRLRHVSVLLSSRGPEAYDLGVQPIQLVRPFEDTERAIALCRELLEDRLRVLGPDHPDTLTSQNDLAYAYQSAGNLERAISLYEQTLADRLRVLGPDHPDTLTSQNDLADARVHRHR